MKNRKHQARSQACVLGMLALLRLFPILSTPPHTIIIALVTLVVMTRNLSSVPTMYQALCQAPLYLILTTTLWSSTTICFIWKPGELKKKQKTDYQSSLVCPTLLSQPRPLWYTGWMLSPPTQPNCSLPDSKISISLSILTPQSSFVLNHLITRLINSFQELVPGPVHRALI